MTKVALSLHLLAVALTIGPMTVAASLFPAAVRSTVPVTVEAVGVQPVIEAQDQGRFGSLPVLAPHLSCVRGRRAGRAGFRDHHGGPPRRPR